jgi:hypothetical protein
LRDNALDFLPNLLLLDEAGEFSITTSNANSSAGFGASTGHFVTPSGTNEYHGSAYWSNRNYKLAANNWFNNQQGVPRPPLNENQIGGVIGGPVFKNKLFFYTNYEAFRLRQQSSANRTILTGPARQGIYTYRDSGGAVQQDSPGSRCDDRARHPAASAAGSKPGSHQQFPARGFETRLSAQYGRLLVPYPQ